MERVIYLMEQVKNENFKNPTSIDMLIAELRAIKMLQNESNNVNETYLKG
jgi:hypothetical protein